MVNEAVILGIDPGTNIMGYGIIVVNKTIKLAQYGVLHVKKYANMYDRLAKISEKTKQLVAEYKPTYMALEDPFLGKNIQSTLKIGRAQGVVMAAAFEQNIPVLTYSPRTIKKTVTGNGAASKEQVAKMLAHQFGIDPFPEFFDATDALSVALCHHYHGGQSPQSANKNKQWAAFLTQNPDKVL